MKLRRTGFHLLIETPEANLVAGLKYPLRTFSQSWNARGSRRDHVFQVRPKWTLPDRFFEAA